MAPTFMISTLLEASDKIEFIGDNLGVQPSCDNNKTSNIQHYWGAVLQYKNPSRMISKTIGWIKGQHALLHLKNLKLPFIWITLYDRDSTKVQKMCNLILR